jgi:tRNA U34 5-methylaminomethyl-2-thiouridine-forming methyltransferase MnmC
LPAASLSRNGWTIAELSAIFDPATLKRVDTADGSPTLYSERFGETFHSTHGASVEAKHVFLQASGVLERLTSGLPTRVLEIGFGLGLNAVITADAATTHRTALDFHSIENDPDCHHWLQTIQYDHQLENPAIALTLREQLANTRCSPIQLSAHVSLTIHWGDATRIDLPSPPFDAIYLDAFSPDSNPECWTQSFFEKLKFALRPHGKLATYSAKGTVRRALLSAGYSVNKVAGPPGKREMMVAQLPDTQ